MSTSSKHKELDELSIYWGNLFQKETTLLQNIPSDLQELIKKEYLHQYILENPESIIDLNEKMEHYVGRIFASDIKKVLSDYSNGNSDIRVLMTDNKNLLPLIWKSKDPDVQKMKSSMKWEVQKQLIYASRHQNDVLDLKFFNVIKAHLSGIDLSDGTHSYYGLDLLQGANLAGANLEGLNFSCADLSTTNLNKANCKKTDFYCCDLNRAQTKGTYFQEAHLEGATINLQQLTDSASIIDAKVFDIKNVTKKLHSQGHLGEESIKPVKIIMVEQYKKLINDSHDIQELIDLFDKARSDTTLRIIRYTFDKEKTHLGKEGKTVSCKEIMQAICQKLEIIVKRLDKPLSQQLANDLYRLDQQVNSGYSFFGGPELAGAVEKNQLLTSGQALQHKGL